MKTFRTVLFWLHLATGVSAGLVILLMSATGVMLTYERQMLAWADARTYRIEAPGAGAARLPVGTLLDRLRDTVEGVPTSVLVPASPTRAVEVSFGRERTVLVNGFTGQALGEGSKPAHAFFDSVTAWHRWLGAAGDGRDRGKAVTGACNLGFLFLVTSGLYLWWPRNWSRPSVRSVAWFRRGLRGKARDFNWHNVIGLWCLVPLFLIVLSGVVISYPWASNLVYASVGEKPPARRGPPGSGPGDQGGPAPAGFGGLNQLWERAERQAPGWRAITMRVPSAPDGPVAFTIDHGTGGEPHKRAALQLDRRTGDVLKWEPYSQVSRGQRIRSFLRFAHTGEVGGIAGQTLAGVASLGACVLVWTGLALTWRRFRAWRGRRPRPAMVEKEQEARQAQSIGPR